MEDLANRSLLSSSIPHKVTFNFNPYTTTSLCAHSSINLQKSSILLPLIEADLDLTLKQFSRIFNHEFDGKFLDLLLELLQNILELRGPGIVAKITCLDSFQQSSLQHLAVDCCFLSFEE